MNADAAGASELRDRGDRLLREDAPSAAVVGVLHRHQGGLREEGQVGPDGGLEVLRSEEAAPAHLHELHAREGGARGDLVEDQVRARADDHLVAGPTVQGEGELVRHGAGGREDGRLLAEDLGRHRFEPMGRGVLAVDVVSHPGLRHGATHGLGGLGDGVGAEIDGAHGGGV